MKPTIPEGANEHDQGSLIQHVVTIVAAMQSGSSSVHVSDIGNLIKNVWTSLSQINIPGANAASDDAALVPAVSINKSIGKDFLVCLEDGKRLKMLKRYIRSRYNLSPEQYRTKWGLPANYPMTSPAYSLRRSALAKQNGLGLAGRRAEAN